MRSSTVAAILLAWASAATFSALAAVSETETAPNSGHPQQPTPPPPAPPPSPQEGRKRVRKPPSPWTDANRAHHDVPPNRERKPNIILILTDDQDVELGSLNFMPRTVRLLREEGAEFRHAYVTTPMCCPSRSSLLTGLYVHNHQTFTNNDNCSSSTWQANFEPRSFATYLSNAGYRTGYFGKYLNKYNGSYIPPGWREWGGLVMNSRYYNYSVNMNGKRVRHGDDYHKDYYPDVIVNESISFLRQSKQSFSRKPVLLVLSFPAPHGPEDSAPQFSNMFFNVTTHHTPTYDYAPNPDKQWILQATGKMKPIHRQFTDLLMTKRLQTLQSVDLGVQRVYEELKALGELDNTYIVYTSDHGYHLGQFGLIKGKSFPFEFDVRVPFLVRGPEVDPGRIIDEIVLNIDLAPTFLDIAGVEPPPHMDGRSFLRLFQRRRRRLRWPDTFLIESSGRRETGDTPSPTPASTTPGSIPESDVQLDNRVAPSPASTFVGKHHRLASECQRQDMRAPCRSNQKWHCLLENGRWRKHKCKMPTFSRTRAGSGSGDAKKCACFTPEGLMYTRFESEARRGFRTKTSDDVLDEDDTRRWKRKVGPEAVADLDRRFQTKRKRRRRSSTDDVNGESVDDIIDDVRKEINLWQTTRPIPRNAEDSSSSPTFPSQSTLPESISTSIPIDSANCSRLSNGSVSCDQTVYSDTKTWRLNREKIEQQIRFLRAQLVTLKDIRRHLREKRPHKKNAHPAGSALFDNSEEEGEREGEGEGEGEDGEDDEDDDILTGKAPGVEQETDEDHKLSPDKHGENCGGKHSPPPAVDLHVGVSTLPDPDHGKEHTCYCEPDIALRRADKEAARALRWRAKSERILRKLRKQRRRAKLEKTCLSERMNCFTHDNQHWRTPPLWSAGPFCFCMNANNNTYSCLRTINATHNFLYCEFVTGLVTFYNLRIDPFEQWNRAHMLTPAESSFMRDQLAQLKACRGSRQCTVGSGSVPPMTSTVLPAHLNRHPRTKRRRYYPQAGRNYRIGPGTTI